MLEVLLSGFLKDRRRLRIAHRDLGVRVHVDRDELVDVHFLRGRVRAQTSIPETLARASSALRIISSRSTGSGTSTPRLTAGRAADRLEPASQVRQPVERDARPLVAAHPRPVRDVGDRIVAGEVLVIRQPRVEHLEQAANLALITVDRVRNALRRVAVEDVRLPHHRPDAAHLEHQPLDHERAAFDVGRQQLPGLLGEIDHDRARLEHREAAVVVIDDRRDAAVRIDLEVPRLLLLALLEVDAAEPCTEARAPRA